MHSSPSGGLAVTMQVLRSKPAQAAAAGAPAGQHALPAAAPVMNVNAASTPNSTRWVRKQEQRQRSLALVLLKGDNVVCVCCAQAAPKV
jgi:hypothetical protein